MFMTLNNDKKLINSVRLNPELYDTAHEQFSDCEHKARIWDEIGKELNRPGRVCKLRWYNIRDQYRKNLMNKIIHPKMGPAKARKYKYAEQLAFLNSYFTKVIKKDVGNDDEEEHNVDTKEINFVSANDDNSDESDNTSMLVNNCETTTDIASSSKYCVLKDNLHPVDVFLAGLAPTLKSLTPYHLNLAKTKIFQAVQEHEMAMIVEQEDNGESYMMRPSIGNCSRISSYNADLID